MKHIDLQLRIREHCVDSKNKKSEPTFTFTEERRSIETYLIISIYAKHATLNPADVV